MNTEQMQKNAEASGQLRIWNQFSISYPWYRFHMVYLLHGVEQFDIGIGLIGGNVMTARAHYHGFLVFFCKVSKWSPIIARVSGL
jgi:hypothetical protein